MWVYLLVYLVKFYMIEYCVFDEVFICIERVLKEQFDDVFLYYICGDIICFYIQNLKEKEDFDVKELFKYVIVSSLCF